MIRRLLMASIVVAVGAISIAAVALPDTGGMQMTSAVEISPAKELFGSGVTYVDAGETVVGATLANVGTGVDASSSTTGVKTASAKEPTKPTKATEPTSPVAADDGTNKKSPEVTAGTVSVTLGEQTTEFSPEKIVVKKTTASTSATKTTTTSGKTTATTSVKKTTATTVAMTTATTSAKRTTTTTAPKTTTTTAPKTTTTSSKSTTSVSGDVRFRPGDNVASIVRNSPKGTVFVFSPGAYKGLSIQPNANQTFIGESGAVLDGNGAKYAFQGSSGVTIKGLEITGYKPSSRDSVIAGGQDWTLINNEVHHNGEKGVEVSSGWTLTGNNIHHNGRYGVTGTGSGVLLSGNEIAYNSTDYGPTGASGGTKFVQTTGLVLRNNYVHHNYGNGLWVDINNVNALIEGNKVVSNQRAGVSIEISCGGTIRNNTINDNGHLNKFPNWMAGSAIRVSDSPNVKVYGNSLSGNEKGIGGLQNDNDNLGAVTHCTPQLKNLDVHDNVITQSGGAAAGLDANNNQGSVWTSWGNKFHGNTYKLSGGAEFRWKGDWITYSQWKANGLS